MDSAGGNNEVAGVDVTFDGSAMDLLPDSAAFPSGSYLPTAYDSSADFDAPGPGARFCIPDPDTDGTPCTGDDALGSELNGFDPNGTWNLYVIDRFRGDAGSIAGGWSLDITAGGGPQRTVTVDNVSTGSGTLAGSGTVTGTGIDCGVDCASADPDGTSVVLTAAAVTGSTFGGFAGCDATTATTCTVTVNGAKQVTATFNPNPPQTLKVTRTGAGTGAVTGTGITCGADCTETYNGGLTVTLTASPDAAGSRFIGWTGCDSQLLNTCTVTLTAAKNVVAAFKQGPDPVPAVTPMTITNTVPGPTPPPILVPTPVGVADTTAPSVTLSGVRSSMSRAAFLRGVKVRVSRSEASSIQATLEAAAGRVTLIADFNASLARKSVASGTSTTTITLKPSRRLVGRARSFRARIRVEVTDTAGNRRTVTKTIRVKA